MNSKLVANFPILFQSGHFLQTPKLLETFAYKLNDCSQILNNMAQEGFYKKLKEANADF